MTDDQFWRGLFSDKPAYSMSIPMRQAENCADDTNAKDPELHLSLEPSRNQCVVYRRVCCWTPQGVLESCGYHSKSCVKSKCLLVQSPCLLIKSLRILVAFCRLTHWFCWLLGDRQIHTAQEKRLFRTRLVVSNPLNMKVSWDDYSQTTNEEQL